MDANLCDKMIILFYLKINTHIWLKSNKFDEITKGFDIEANLSDLIIILVYLKFYTHI